MLDVDVPIVGAVNGPARVHAELPLLSDVVIASESAVFQDAVHFERGVVPGDGVHTLWPLWLGPNRGRYFLLMGQETGAEGRSHSGSSARSSRPIACSTEPRRWRAASLSALL
jgi:enoyl-CoA hydratase/carnithine racemase